MFKRTAVALSVAALLFAGIAAAQQTATIVLRSGERLTNAQLMDLGGVGFTVGVSGQERKIPTNDVAVIDFTGGGATDADYSKVTGGQHLLVMKSGQTVTGQLTDIGGSAPLRITFRTESGDRDFNSNEISRIVLARPSDTGVAATSGGSGQGITVSAKQKWTPTGITVRKGDWITLNTSGEIRLSGDPNDVATPDGAKNQRFDPGSPLPQTLTGALIGRVGNGRPFGIGNQTRIQVPDSGQLFLGVNDSNMADNDGSFQVTVQRESGPSRR